ncbi:MAG: flagellar hook-associated protein FlgL [Negativicutes bacterium]
MRITNSMMTQSVIRNINDNMERLSEAQEKASTGVKIQQASEDPIAATNTLKYRSYLAKIEQYQANAADATSWMEVTEDTLSELTDVVQQIRDLTSQAASDILEDSELAAIEAEVTELKASALDLLNTQYGGRYIFGGYSTAETPYEETTATYTDAAASETTTLSTVSFKDGYLSLGGVVSTTVDSAALLALYNANSANIYTSTGEQAITYNTGYSSQTAVNVEGQDLTGTGAGNLFDTIDKLLLALNGETSCQSVVVDATTGAAGVTTTEFSIDELLDEIDANLELILTATSSLGARMNSVEICSGRLSSDYTTYTGLLSTTVDADLSVATTEYSTAQTIYDASLAVGAKVITDTLVDYLT